MLARIAVALFIVLWLAVVAGMVALVIYIITVVERLLA